MLQSNPAALKHLQLDAGFNDAFGSYFNEIMRLPFVNYCLVNERSYILC